MKVLIEPFISMDDWTSDASFLPYAINEHEDFIADGNAASVIFEIPEGSNGHYCEKEFANPIDVTGYQEIVFHIWSRWKSGHLFRRPADFMYSIDFGSTVYYVPIYPGFNDVTIRITATTIDRIRITALHDDADYILLSQMVGVSEELPLDIYTAAKTAIEDEIARKYPDGILVGTVTCSAGASSVSLDGMDFIDRFAVIKIDDGVNSEIHQIDEFNETTAKFSSIYDGASVLHSYTAANVYLQLPIDYKNEEEVHVPGAQIYGFTSEHVWRGAALEDVYDTFTDSGAQVRREGTIDKYIVMVTAYARHGEIISILSEAIKTFIDKQYIWVNSRYHEIEHEGTPTELDPTQVYELIPQITFNFTMEIKGDNYDRKASPKITSTITTFNIIE